MHSPELKGFVGWTISKKKNHGQQSNKNWSCSRKGQSGPESKRGCFAQIFHRTPVGFGIMLNNILLLTSPNFGGSFKETFK